MVVQCNSCQTKFRIADEKVTDRGVRVRCTSCKNVFQVRKAGAAGADGAPGPGSTLDLSSLGAAAIAKSGSNGAIKPPGAARPGTGPVKPSTGPVNPSKPSTGPVKPPTGPVKSSKPSTGPVKPPTGPVKPPTGPVKPPTGPLRASASRAASQEKLDADDLFGMAELTGDAPLSTKLDAPPPPPPAPAAPAKTGQSRATDLIDLEFDLDDKPAKAAPSPASPPKAPDDDPLAGVLDPPVPPAAAAAPPPATASQSIQLETDPVGTPAPGNGAAAAEKPAIAEAPARPPPEPRPKSEPVRLPAAMPRPAATEIAPVRAIVASALTGLLGAALAMVLVIVSALSDDAAAGWLGFGPAADVIATGVVSGLYDTAGGKPVFYVRGRVENRTGKARGPVRVTAELVADGSPEARVEAMAGSEPTPEDVWSVRSPSDADRLSRSLQSARVERKVAPGASLPFFALFAEPPADLQKHHLRIRIETVDGWTPSSARTARDN